MGDIAVAPIANLPWSASYAGQVLTRVPVMVTWCTGGSAATPSGDEVMATPPIARLTQRTTDGERRMRAL
ncbi:hypothetical protein GCM10009795_015300 [Nocardioides hankookensis]